MDARFDENTFVVPHEDGYLVYAPLAGRVVRVNAQCVAQLKRYLETRDSAVVDRSVVDSIGGLGWLHPSPCPIPLPVDRHYHPASATLFLTSGCNLRCAYCYAEAGDSSPQVMKPEVYRSAIDLVCSHARRAGRAPAFSFHGGGEPTTAWPTLNDAVEYARSVAGGSDGGQLSFGLATNGVMSRQQAEYVAATFSMVNLSLDGPS